MVTDAEVSTGLRVQAACPHVALCTVFQFSKPSLFPGGTWQNRNKLHPLASLPALSPPARRSPVPRSLLTLSLGVYHTVPQSVCVCFPLETGSSLGMDLNSLSFSYLSHGLGRGMWVVRRIQTGHITHHNHSGLWSRISHGSYIFLVF